MTVELASHGRRVKSYQSQGLINAQICARTMAIHHTGSTMRARTVNIRFQWLLTVRAHGQYSHRYLIVGAGSK